MTLSERNAIFMVGIVFCVISTLLIIAASFLVIPVYPTMEENIRRPVDFFQNFIGRFLKADYFAVHTSLAASVLFSIIGIFLIYSFFEQTSAPEILYIAIFTISFSFETIRLLLPLHLIFDIPSFYLLIAARVLLFARYFSIYSLFAASICAAGLEIQKTRNIILVSIIAALVTASGVPIDTQSWNTSLNMLSGYTALFRMIEMVAFFTTVISFFVAANVRGSKDYTYIGIGVIFALIGRYFLITFDNWAGPVLGVSLLSIGTWYICSKLHKIHLWL